MRIETTATRSMFIEPVPALVSGPDPENDEAVWLLGYIGDPDRMLYVDSAGNLATRPLDWFTVEIRPVEEDGEARPMGD